jgi:tRNA nucleotidyltransferase (CCA-adding enzyme)
MITEEVLSLIVPKDTENQNITGIVENVKSEILKSAQAMNLDLEPVLVGSVAKGTHLIDPDIDIFVMFPPTTKREDLENYGLKIGVEVLKDYEKRYAEHPYVMGKIQGYSVEIVPCYKIEDPSQKMSAVDRTPFHTNYVIEHLKEEQKNDVRLLKRFLKGIGIYGAEAEIEGFSGYLCELLILCGGSFSDLIENVKDWKKGKIIKFDNKKHTEFNDPLIVIDPVDPTRNVASALSSQNMAIFIHACKEFSKKPKMEFFFPNKPKPESLSSLKEIMNIRETKIMGITFEKPDVISDILHSQLRKAQKVIIKLCERSDFNVIAADFFVNKNIEMIFEFDLFSIPSIKLHKGPPIWHENSKDFHKKWVASPNLLKGPYIKGGHWYVDIKREFTDAKSLIEKNLMDLNLGSYITDSLKKKNEILVGEEMVEERFATQLTMFFFKKFPWEY